MNKISITVEEFDGNTFKTTIPVKDTDLKKLKKMFMKMDFTKDATVIGRIINVEVVK